MQLSEPLIIKFCFITFHASTFQSCTRMMISAYLIQHKYMEYISNLPVFYLLFILLTHKSLAHLRVEN